MKDYVTGTRVYPLLVRTSQLHKFAEQDFEDVAAYLASLDLSADERFNIRPMFGDAMPGKKIFRTDCKNCHNKDGYGKPSKEATPLAGQRPEYPYTTMRGFKEGHRVHANAKEDDIFEDYSDADFVNLAAYLATLDDKKIVEGYRLAPPMYRPSFARTGRSELSSSVQITDIRQTVVRMSLDDGVTTADAETAMMIDTSRLEALRELQRPDQADIRKHVPALFIEGSERLKQGMRKAITEKDREALHLAIAQTSAPP